MAGERILVVEDEQIVAEDLQDMLRRLGYRPVGTAASGEEAIRKSQETTPDLVLMDIRLSGEIDGVEAAETIWAEQGIPVTYLTAYADENTLERAKATMPYGYILKPFEEQDLRTTIEIALHKHAMEAVTGKMEGWYASTLESLTDAIITTNARGLVTFLNPSAESLTGWVLSDVYGKKFSDVFGEVKSGRLTAKDGKRVPGESQASPIKEKDGHIVGQVIVIRRSHNLSMF